MRRGKALLSVVILALVALQAAAASQTGRATFLVSLSGSVSKRWTYATSTKTLEGCTVRTSGAGTRTISYRSADNSVVRASRSGAGLARFSGTVRALGETVHQSGTKTIRETGDGCDTTPRRLVCKPLSRSLQGRALGLVSHR